MAFFLVGCPFSVAKYRSYQEQMSRQPTVEERQKEERKTPYERCMETASNMRSDNDAKDFEVNVCDRIPYH
jgi:hypothetical protein